MRPRSKSDIGRRGFSSSFPIRELKPSFLLTKPRQEAAHTVLLPAGRRLQLLSRRTLSAAEQVDAGLLLRVFLGCWFDFYAKNPTGTPPRPSAGFGTLASLLRFLPFNRRWRLVCSDASAIFVSSTGQILAIGWFSGCAAAPHARRSHHPKAPPLRRGALGRWRNAF